MRNGPAPHGILWVVIGFFWAPVSFPAQLSLTGPLETTGDRELTILLAGQSAALTRDTNAATLIASLAEETSRHLRSFSN